MSHRRRSLHARRELDNLRDMSNASQAKQTQLADIGATARATGTRFKNSPEVENGTGALETAAMNHGPNLRTRIAILFDMIIASVYDVPLRGFHAAQQFVAILAGIFFALVARNQEEDSVADKA
ncbi:hypothetical protein M8818_004216 [Zalaria obscura]|uniref:Uncharacterized protein n=1 Tax=Zalaria obscura TaxID=2024903 RepID=A0ACC3SFQ0_9PEZI